MGYEILRHDGPIDDPAVHGAHNAFDNVMLEDEDPTFGSRRLDDTAASLSSPPSVYDVSRWFAMDGDVAIGVAELYKDTEDVGNLHLGWFELGVLPSHRRAGLGRQLLRAVAEAASAAERPLIMCETTSLVPAGDLFLESCGFEAGLVERISQVMISDIDRELMDRWIERGRSQSDRFELIWLEGRWPEAMHDDVVAMSHVMNDAPVGDLDFNDQAFTVGHITAQEDDVFGRGFTRLTAAVQDRASGRLAGYSQLYINPSFPDLGQQGDTGVLEEFRGNRLGRWLKAEVARHLMEGYPEITRVRTGNAHSNAPMLAINEAMGFARHHDDTIWQKETAALLAD